MSAIFHPSDNSATSQLAFAHALKIALAKHSSLTLLHVESDPFLPSAWWEPPHVRDMLHSWGLLEADAPREKVFRELGVHVEKVTILANDPLRGIFRYVGHAPVDLVVLSTEGRDGLPRWLHPSIAEGVVRHVHAPSLFVSRTAGGFVDGRTGELSLRRVLVPVAHEPNPQRAVDACTALLEALAVTPECVDLIHIGTKFPVVDTSAQPGWNWQQHIFSGEVVESLLTAAQELSPDLIVMTTKGHHGFLDAFRGSDTERLVRDAPCPVLAVPAT